MRIRWIVLLILVGVGSVHAETTGTCDPWAAKIASVQGTVEAKRHNQTDWLGVKQDEIYCPGDSIRVGDNSRAGIILINETLLRLDENSAITLTALAPNVPSILDLLKGIAHFISRVPRSLKVNTPFVNAAIEGTEFVVAVSNTDTTVTVFEGKVLTQNDQGEVRITQGESAVAAKGAAPEKTLLAKPRNVVQWALYFPPVFDKAEGNIQQAQRLLSVGRVEAARNLLASETSAQAKALQSIIAVVSNDSDAALSLAQESVAGAPDVAASHIALSYAWQSKLDLDMALNSGQQAVKVEPNNALAWARVAELQLSTGNLNDALSAANEATRLNPELSRTQSILGYAYLVRIDIDNAMTAFNKAIQLDQADPLPRLGLGLAKIRRNQMAEGRREIEIAASLDPNNAIIRSYLGKAYYEEKRAPLVAEQYAMAKQLDSNDPTPYYYDAIRKQTENNPVGALEDLNKSIELNDNRAVYRSSLQLDQDEAARNVNLADIYQTLGFNQLALTEGLKSVTNDPTNHSSHLFLAEAYTSLPRHEIAHVSQLLQSQLLQPSVGSSIEPFIANTNLSTPFDNTLSKSSLNEYNSLFTQNDLMPQFSLISGSNDTFGENVSLVGVADKFSLSLGQLHYETDGYRQNNDQKFNFFNLVSQYNVTSNTSVQLEFRRSDSQYGDIESRFDLSNIYSEDRYLFDEDTTRLGLRHAFDSSSTILLSYIDTKERNFSHTSRTDVSPPVETTIVTDNQYQLDGKTAEIQYLNVLSKNKLIIGAGAFEQKDISTINATINLSIGGTPLPPSPLPQEIIDREISHSNFYIYDYYNLTNSILLTLGISHDDYTDDDINSSLDINTDGYSPKFGLEWAFSNNINLRLASFRNLKRPLLANQTLEPTQIAGFNQFFDDINASDITRNGIGLDFKTGRGVYSGVEFSKRNIDIPQISGSVATQEELLHRLYFYWTPTISTALSAEYIYDQYSTDFHERNIPDYLKTQSFPLRFSYFYEQFSTSVIATYVDQYIERPVSVGVYTSDNSDFTTVDLELGYKLESNAGRIVLAIKNIFDTQFKYQDRNFQTTKDRVSQYIPEINFFIGANINF